MQEKIPVIEQKIDSVRSDVGKLENSLIKLTEALNKFFTQGEISKAKIAHLEEDIDENKLEIKHLKNLVWKITIVLSSIIGAENLINIITK